MVHAVKVKPEYFMVYASGQKLFEVRKNDRPYKVGDFLALNEYNGKEYTGRCAMGAITYILEETEYCAEGYVVLGLKPCAVISRKAPKPDVYWRNE